VFDRTANLANNQIINYRCDPSEKWLVLIGIAPGSPEVCVSFPIATFHALHFDLPVIPLISICLCVQLTYCPSFILTTICYTLK